ncbi:MAG: hypothetical protein K8U03_14680 [Planctomycetia bacterium]|nr:hypothetical protein [Planctomycetia bacterium]
MKTTSKPWSVLAIFIASASLLTGGGIGNASELASVPPELATGDLQLVFDQGVDPKNLQGMVEETWEKSKALRIEALAKRMAPEAAKVGGPDNWMAALQQKKWLPEANAFIRASVTASREKQTHADVSTGWYCYFGPGGKFPDRLEPETIALLKETMWRFANYWLNPEGSSEGPKGSFAQNMSKYQDGKPYELLPLDWSKMWGNENHEIRYKPPMYLALDVLRKDPAYANRRIDGKTIEEWFAIIKPHLIDMLRDRVMAGLWAEPGSGYAHITHEHLVRLCTLAPDREIRQVAKMVLDLVFIEEEELSVNGVRGGGRSRAGMPGINKHAGIINLVYGEGVGDGRFSIDFELSDYQAPAIAVVLRRAKGTVKPYVIYNRLPGEIRKELPIPGYARDSRLINYVYRTPGYSLGCALLNPNLTYHPSSDQQRANTLLFQSGQWVFPTQKNIPSKVASGRSGRAYWNIQHENVLILQQFGDSERVEEMQVLFSGALKMVDIKGWIFAAADSGYAAVRFIDPAAGAAATGYKWDTDYKPHWTIKEEQRIAAPTGKFLPILIHAGYPDRDGTFEQFQKTVLEGTITIEQAKSRIEYQPKGGAVITWFYNQNAKPLERALINGEPPNLEPALVFDGPFMKAKFGDPQVYVGAGPFRAVYDLEKMTVTESKK